MVVNEKEVEDLWSNYPQSHLLFFSWRVSSCPKTATAAVYSALGQSAYVYWLKRRGNKRDQKQRGKVKMKKRKDCTVQWWAGWRSYPQLCYSEGAWLFSTDRPTHSHIQLIEKPTFLSNDRQMLTIPSLSCLIFFIRISLFFFISLKK